MHGNIGQHVAPVLTRPLVQFDVLDETSRGKCCGRITGLTSFVARPGSSLGPRHHTGNPLPLEILCNNCVRACPYMTS